MPDKIKVLDKRDFPSTDPRRVGKMDTIITYQLDPFHTYVITMPKEDFTEPKLKEVIKTDIAERKQWINKEIEV